jgi:hypothetical protein
MGSSKTEQKETQQNSGSSWTTFDKASDTERNILNQYRGLGEQQLGFLNNLVNGGTSPFTLNANDQAQLDKSYQSAFDRFNLEGKDYVDYLATTRGLNKSDDPVSQQALQRYGLGMGDLLSQKANAGLNMGLQGTQMRLMGSQALPAGMGAAFSPMYNERMASGTMQHQGSGSGTSIQTHTPSLMTQIGQGMQLAAGMGSMVGGAMMGMPSMGGMGMGSGARANQSFGNYGTWL